MKKICSFFSQLTSGKSRRKWDEFYKAFELRFRGHPDDIYKRLKERYGELLRHHYEQMGGGIQASLDLGSGHGEFLSLSKEAGFCVAGVDLSGEAVRTCQEKGMTVLRSDSLKYLKKQKSSVYSLISCLHMVEHCEPDYVFSLLGEVVRCLRPGGLVLIETPSLYSLWAGTRQFYLDPTHKFPLHPDYLEFLLRYYGLERVRTEAHGDVMHPLRGSAGTGEDSTLKLWDQWLFGPMDLSCLGWKS